jgi:hypothetical protein
MPTPFCQNFLLATLFHNGGIAILLSALSALYQMTFAGFFVHLNSIPPVLRWLQWLCPLKYTLEALSVNEVGSGLMIQDTLQGVPVDVSASLIMNLVSHLACRHITSMLKLESLVAFWVRVQQLLSGRSGIVCLYRGIRGRGNRRCLAQSS